MSLDSLFESCSVALVFLWFRSVPTFLASCFGLPPFSLLPHLLSLSLL